MLEDDFWDELKNNNITKSRVLFDKLDSSKKEAVLDELYQAYMLTKKPMMISILRRDLQGDNSFNDFYKAWFPEPKMCNETKVGNQVYQQGFPAPVRVFNGINMNNAKEIFSVGITWVSNVSQEKLVLEYLDRMKAGKDKSNETRHDKIDKVADGQLLGVCRVESDDNLGTPF